MSAKQPTVATEQSASPHCFKVLITDLIGIKFNQLGQADFSEVKQHIQACGAAFHCGAIDPGESYSAAQIHFFYQPQLSREQELLAQTAAGQYDACIAAATFIPSAAKFKLGAVRIGAGTANMGSKSWGGGSGLGGSAPLMNTPSYNSRATAQSAFKALLKVLPDLAVNQLHQRVVAGDFDTGKQLAQFPCCKLEGRRLALIGYGNIGREMAKLGAAFGMQVVIYARAKHRQWIESEGFEYASSLLAAATNADVISPHIGLGALHKNSGNYANAGLLDAAVFSAMKPAAILINYDRGEVVDIVALDHALSSGQISYAAIDADLFKDPMSGELSGPMVSYRDIYPQHIGKMELLPHAAADTEHVSRVEGAKQAVDQIIAVIAQRSVTNLVGDLPPSFLSAGTKTVLGVGKVDAANLNNLDAQQLQTLSEHATQMADFWSQMHHSADAQERETLISQQAEQLILVANHYTSLMQRLGLQGPYQK